MGHHLHQDKVVSLFTVASSTPPLTLYLKKKFPSIPLSWFLHSNHQAARKHTSVENILLYRRKIKQFPNRLRTNQIKIVITLEILKFSLESRRTDKYYPINIEALLIFFCSLRCLTKQEIMGEQQKCSILSNELVRMLSNIHKDAPTRVREEVIEHFTRQMVNSRYGWRQSREIVVSGIQVSRRNSLERPTGTR